MLVESRRSISCRSSSRNLDDYIVKYQPLLDECIVQSFNEPAAVARLKQHNRDVYKTMVDTTRYSAYNRRLFNSNRFTRPEQIKIVQDQLAAIKKANQEYSDTQKKYLAQIDDVVAKMNPTQAMQTCRDTILTENNRMVAAANELIDLPKSSCDQLKAALDTFNTELEPVYKMINVAVPK